jgi:DNA polymerase I-like protein with 3'-5' exonuclease and polymerase domains
MILTVHDELLFEMPEARAQELADVVRDRKQSAAT